MRRTVKSDRLLACLIHVFVTLGGLVVLLGRLPALPYFKAILEPQIVAFTTASSSATLPVTMRAAQERLGISNAVASFALPLGTSINKNGELIYHSMAALIIAQMLGINLTLGQSATLIATALLASIGAPGVPGGGLMMLSMVLTSIGLPLEGIAVLVGIDGIIDMARTAVSVTGNLAVAAIIAKGEDELDMAVYFGKSVDKPGLFSSGK